MKSIFKRLTALILSLMLLTAFTFVKAESGQGITLSAVRSDDYITVKISAETSFTGINGKLLYDTSKLRFESAVLADGLQQNTVGDSVKDKSDGINFAVLGEVNGGTKGDFISFKFKIISKDSFDAAFTLSGTTAAGLSAEQISVSDIKTHCQIDIKYGDVNSDGTVDILDLVRLKKVLAGISVSFSALNSDCDKNSVINTLDMALLRKHFFGANI